MISYYDVLGVHPLASAEEIRQAYLAKCRSCHPDTRCSGYSVGPGAGIDMNLIKDAYRHLQDPLLREQHDLILRSAPPQAPMSAMMPYSATHQHQQQQTSFSSPSQPSPRQQRTPYELLGLNPSATLQDILNAFQYYSAMNLSAEDRALLNQAFTTLLESRYEHPSIQSPPVQQQAPPIFSLNMSINFGSSGFQFR